MLDSAAIAGFHQIDDHEEADAYPAVIWTGVHIRIVACQKGIGHPVDCSEQGRLQAWEHPAAQHVALRHPPRR